MTQTTPPNLPPTLYKILSDFIEDWHQQQKTKTPENLLIEFDKDWPSLCYQSGAKTDSNELLVQWAPIKQTDQDMFTRLEQALNTKVHPDIVTFYTSYWANHLQASSPDGDLELLQIWNQEDMERLRSNLIGHALDKKKRKQPLSFFFAITIPDDGMLCLNNDTGEIWYELPGKKPVRKIADSLAQFISSLQPNTTITSL
jgi:SecY interacting protein Syd